MKFVSFNVNSIRTRLHQLEAVVSRYNPDFIGLQETKVTDPDFPIDALNPLNYHTEFMGQKTHYGVALMATKPFSAVIKGFANDDESAQKRFIGGEFKLADGRSLYVYNGYFPQGESREHPVKFPAKQKYYQDLLNHLNENHSPNDAIIVMGDLNVAPNDLDIGIGPDAHKRWLKAGKASFLPEERQWFEQLLGWGLNDGYRQKHPDSDELFSWFDYRSKGFEREPRRGLRIDFVLHSNALNDNFLDAGIDYEIRAMEKPSDHCPVWSEFKDLSLA